MISSVTCGGPGIKYLILGYIEESTQPICYVDYPSGKFNAQNISKTLCEYICLKKKIILKPAKSVQNIF